MRWPSGPGELGLVTRRTALAAPAAGGLGLSGDAIRWRLAQGDWQALHRGVYLKRPGPVDWFTRCAAALLACGPTSALCDETAAILHGLIEWPVDRAPWLAHEVRPPTPDVHVVVPLPTRRHTPTGVVLRRSHEPMVFRSYPRRTSVASTIVDLGRRMNADDLAGLIGRAVRQRMTSPELVVQDLGRRARHPQRDLLIDLLNQRREGVEFPLEVRFTRDVLRRHRLPLGQAQVLLADVTGNPSDRQRFDRGISQLRVLFELNGRAFHGRERSAIDRFKAREAMRVGWLVLTYEWGDVVGEQACRTATEIAHALRERGWRGRMASCRVGCRPAA